MFSKTSLIYPTLWYVYICSAKWPNILSLTVCILFFTPPHTHTHIEEEKEKAVIIALR